MSKPTLNTPANELSQEDLSLMTETYDGKKVIGRAADHKTSIIWLEDGTEVIRDLETGQFLDEWPEDE